MLYVKSEPDSVAPMLSHCTGHESVNLLPTTVFVGSAVPRGAQKTYPASTSRFGVAVVGIGGQPVLRTRNAPGTRASAPSRQKANHPPCPVGRAVVGSLIIGSYMTDMPIRSTIAYCLKSP